MDPQAALGRTAEAHGPSAGYRGAGSGSGVGRARRELAAPLQSVLAGTSASASLVMPGVELQGPCPYHRHKAAQLRDSALGHRRGQ